MNQKKAELRKKLQVIILILIGCELSTDYNVRDTSEVLGYINVGANVDGTDKFEQMITIKCTATLKMVLSAKLINNPRKMYNKER